MKNVFKKAVSLTVALSTVAALSVSAFATEISTGSASYSADGISVAVTGYGDGDTALDAGQYAVAIVPAGETTYTDDMIYYVNQADETTIVTILANMLVKEELAAGDYEVRIGNNANDDLNVLTFTVAAESDKDYITSTDTTKGTIVADVATVAAHSSSGMGLAAGCAIVSLALDATAYPNADTTTPAYSIAVVDANGAAVDGATVYYSAERAKYVALIPETVTDYKFEVVADGTANEVITKYGNINEDTADKINATDFGQVRKIYKKLSGVVTESSAKKALIGDVNGDGKINATDFGQIRKAYKGLDYTFKVLEK